MKVDCHIHSLHSDGVYTISEIIPKLLKEQIEVFAITDHDTVSGTKEARELGKNKMKFISGIEFTCREITIGAIEKTFSIHLLGYHLDEDNPNLLLILEDRRKRVVQVFENLCQEITALGYPIAREEVPISCGNVMQLCDIATYLRLKYPTADNSAFDMIECYNAKLNDANIPIKTAIDSIHEAGGKAVWAHPFYVYKDFRKISIARQDVKISLEHLKAMGLDGLEAYYAAFNEEERKWLKTLACQENLIYTAGSDFHGLPGRGLIGIEIESPNP